MESQDSPHGSSERRNRQKVERGRKSVMKMKAGVKRGKRDENHHVTSGTDNIAPNNNHFSTDSNRNKEWWGETGCLTGALLHHHTTGLETLTGFNKH